MNKSSMRNCSSRPHELHIQRWSNHLKVTDSRGVVFLRFLMTVVAEKSSAEVSSLGTCASANRH